MGPSTLSDWKRSYPEFARALVTEKYEPDVIREVEVGDATDGDFRLSKVEGFRLAPPEPSTAEPRRRFDDYDAGQAALNRRVLENAGKSELGRPSALAELRIARSAFARVHRRGYRVSLVDPKTCRLPWGMRSEASCACSRVLL